MYVQTFWLDHSIRDFIWEYIWVTEADKQSELCCIHAIHTHINYYLQSKKIKASFLGIHNLIEYRYKNILWNYSNDFDTFHALYNVAVSTEKPMCTYSKNKLFLCRNNEIYSFLIRI